MLAWFSQLPLWLAGLLMLATMLASGATGYALRRWNEKRDPRYDETRNETQESYVVGSALTLFGLLIGFTFALVVDRYETRRQLVVEEANAIEALYLRANLLGEPHRGRYTELLTRYVDNHVRLAQADRAAADRLLADNRRLLKDLWAVTVPAFESMLGSDFSTTLVDSVNQVIALDTSRKAARTAQIPPAVFGVLFLYAILTAVVLGYVLIGRRGRLSGAFLIFLFTVALMLLSDFNSPTTGAIRESQEPMERLQAVLHDVRPELFDRLRAQPHAPGP